jgi:hypothetical protein
MHSLHAELERLNRSDKGRLRGVDGDEHHGDARTITGEEEAVYVLQQQPLALGFGVLALCACAGGERALPVGQSINGCGDGARRVGDGCRCRSRGGGGW